MNNPGKFVAGIVLAAACAGPARAGGKVLLVHSYHAGYSWVDDITRGVQKALEGAGVELQVFHMDTKRRTDPEWKVQAGETALEKTDAFQPDVVIAADDNAQEFFAKKLIGRAKPQVVFCGVNAEPSRYGYPAANVTGMLERVFFKRTAALLRQLAPAAGRLAFIADKGETSDAVIAYLKTVKDAPAKVASYETAGTFAEWQALVRKHQTDADALLFGTYHTIRDGSDGLSMDPMKVMAWTMAHNRKPTAGFFDFDVEDGVLCAVAQSGEEHGRRAAEMAKRLMAGSAAKDIPIETAQQGSSMINLRTAAKLGLTVPEAAVHAADRVILDLDLDARSALSAFTALTEERVCGVLSSLKLLAAGEPAQAAMWEAMRNTLAEYKPWAPDGALWFARPDGVYYTTEQGLMAQRIADRPYFARLMSGETVVGELLVSRSTRRKSAVIAVPIMKDGRVVGAIGLSLFLDELSRSLERSLDLPENVVFYALDAKGQAALHRDTRRLLVSPSELESPTLKQAVEKMFSRAEGTAQYDFEGTRRVVAFKESRSTGWRFVIGVQTADLRTAEAAKTPARELLARLKALVSASLERMDEGLRRAGARLAASGLAAPAAREAVSRLCLDNPEAVDCAAVDAQGTMTVLEPAEYRKLEGAYIGDQEHVIRLRKTKAPVMSRLFRTVEGFDAVDIEHPVLASDGSLQGSASLLLRPEFLLASAAASLPRGANADVSAMQDDGLILYDRHSERIGRKLFDDPLHKALPQLAELRRRMPAEESGCGTYGLPAKDGEKPGRKVACWDTVGLHGAQWRLIVTRALEGSR